MAKPKRHHWWPLVQSSYWTDADGLVFVTRADGSTFRANPINIGVESELYTRFGERDAKDTAVEEWFANAIDGPAKTLIHYLLDESKYRRKPFQGDPAKARTVRDLGFRTPGYVELVTLPDEIRLAIARYVAALLVRHPDYLAKLVAFHGDDASSRVEAKNRALANMLYLHQLYTDNIREAVILLTRRDGKAEYLYADGGLVVREPWRASIPFDIHAPLTPDLALEVLPIPRPLPRELGTASVLEATNQGVSRQNRIVLGGAKRFVFSRQQPPIAFIRKFFGVPAPQNIGYRYVNGRLETRYDPSRR
jgi:hypothetical protein